MQREKFLLWMLAGIFMYQAGLFTFAAVKCSQVRADQVTDVCPSIGKRYDTTFAVMVSTTLALLTGGSLNKK